MKAVVLTGHGGPEVLQVQERPDPPVGPGEVRIAVKAAGINFADTMARVGLYPEAPKPPCVLGYEVAGEVESVGPGVETVKVGDRVMAGTRFGGQASMVSVPEGQVIPLARLAQLRAGRSLPGQLLHRLRRTGDHGRASRGRARPDPRRGRRRRNLRNPDRPFPRRRDLRDCLGLKARCDQRAGSGPRDRLSDHGLRAGGQADHGGRGGRRDHGRHRPDELPQGLPRTARGRPADHVRRFRADDRAGAEHPHPGSKSAADANGDHALVEEPRRSSARTRASSGSTCSPGRTARASTG